MATNHMDEGLSFTSSEEQSNTSSNSEELSPETSEILRNWESLENEVRGYLNRNKSKDSVTERNDLKLSDFVDQYLVFMNVYQNEIRPLLQATEQMKSDPDQTEQLKIILPSLCQAYQQLAKHREHTEKISKSLQNIESIIKFYDDLKIAPQVNNQNRILETLKRDASIKSEDN